MPNEHVITGLLRKRQTLVDKLEAVQDKVRQHVEDVNAVDATIRLCQILCEIGIVRIRPMPCRYTLSRGESGRLTLNMLREADGPVMT